ncbi:hypothetical protein BHE74_00002905 [Ensete ventricosum]|nr:hypothetical protein GW17_00011674 [Ensete ventricosum]RWW88226.1 hypothetical protein BHE74_00002905 [Ensete ventricosum]RZR76143.1 hypothetical protein BHM03_00000767 [Ensete ventricosum]
MLFMVSSPVSAEAGNTVPSAHNHLPMLGPTRLSPVPPRRRALRLRSLGKVVFQLRDPLTGSTAENQRSAQLTATDPWGPPSLWCPVGSAQVRNPDPGPTRHHLDGG